MSINAKTTMNLIITATIKRKKEKAKNSLQIPTVPMEAAILVAIAIITAESITN